MKHHSRVLAAIALFPLGFVAACGGPAPEKVEEATKLWCEKQAVIAKMNAEADMAKKDAMTKEIDALQKKMDAALDNDTKAKAEIMKSAKCSGTADAPSN